MWLPSLLLMTMLHERKNLLQIGFSEICEDVASLACGGHFNCHLVLYDTKNINDLINYGLITNHADVDLGLKTHITSYSHAPCMLR